MATITITGDYVVAQGQTETGDTFVLKAADAPATDPKPNFTDLGTVSISSSQDNTYLTGFTTSGISFTSNSVSLLTVGAGASLTVSSTGTGSPVYLDTTPSDWSLGIDNDGLIAVSAADTASGPSVNADFNNAGTLQVSANGAIGVSLDGNAALHNSGQITVTGGGAIINGVRGGAIGVENSLLDSNAEIDNSGTITVTATGGGSSIGILFTGQHSDPAAFHIVNTGTITAQTAIEGQIELSPPQTPRLVLDNTGTINGDIITGEGPGPDNSGYSEQSGYLGADIHNAGAINGDITLSAYGLDFYNGVGGTLAGTIHLGAGMDFVNLGDGGGTVVGSTGPGSTYGSFGVGVVVGGSGDDNITGGSGADILTGGGGNDVLTGGLGADVFAMAASAGSARVTDFSHAQGDRIDLSEFAGLSSLSSVEADSVQSGSDTVITVGSSVLTLQGVTLNDLTASDFIFAAANAPIAVNTSTSISYTQNLTFIGSNGGLGAYELGAAASLSLGATMLVESSALNDSVVGVRAHGAGASLDVEFGRGYDVVAATGAGSTAYLFYADAASTAFSLEGLASVTSAASSIGVSLNLGGNFVDSGLLVVEAAEGPATGVYAGGFFQGTIGTTAGGVTFFGDGICVSGPGLVEAFDLTAGASFTNTGTITATSSGGSAYGVVVGDNVGGASTIVNSGLIDAQYAVASTGGSGHILLTNSGRIFGDVVFGASAGNQLHNTGAIHGDVTFEGLSGSQLFDGRGGSVSGAISFASGASGADTAYLGDDGETVQGGSAALLAYGGAGDDTIVGGSSNDHLTGSGGSDTLTGGLGADTFAASGAGDVVITDFSHAQGDKIDLSALSQFTSFSAVLAAATPTNGGADTTINNGSGSVVLKNVALGSLVAGDFDFYLPPTMHINVTYDASVLNSANAASIEAAVQAAVQFFEQTFVLTTPINIQVGYGEVDGQTVSPSAIAESIGNRYADLTYQQVRAALIAADAANPAAGWAANELPTTDPTGGARFEMTDAEAKALGFLTTTTNVDGYVGISTATDLNFDPNNRAVAGKVDAVGAIEHEISEVLGRVIFADGSAYAAPFDLFRFTPTGARTFQPGASDFGFDSKTLLAVFNNSAQNQEDAGDWAAGGTVDSFDAAGTFGVLGAISPVDLQVMEALGYHLSFTAPTVSGVTPVTPLTVSTSASLAAGQTLSFNGPAAVLFSPTSSQTGPAYTNAGAIVDDGSASDTDVVGVRYDPAATATLAAGVASTFTNASTGSLSVTASTAAADAIGIYSGPTRVQNDGQITVASGAGDGFGDVNTSYNAGASGTLTVQAANLAVGLYLNGAAAETVVNAGQIQASGKDAIGVAYASSLDNSGDIVATAVGTGSQSIGVYLGAGQTLASLTNDPSGTITAQTAIVVGPEASALVATITNTGTFNGAVDIDQGAITLDSHAGTINGTVNLAGGSSTVALGAENNTVSITGGTHVVDAGGGANTVSYVDASSGVHVSLALQGQAQVTGVGTDTLSHFQALVGSNNNDTLEGGGSGASTLTGGLGADTFVFRPGEGAVTVADFSAIQADRIDLTAFTTLHTLADVLGLASSSGPDTVLALPGGGSVTLQGVAIGDLTRSDFAIGSTPADLYGTGQSDILFQNNGQLAVWSLNGTALSGAFVPTVAAGWVAQDTGDFNGDGMSGDVFFRNPATGQSAIWDMSGTQIVGSALLPTAPTSWQVQGTGDFNGDGMSDVLWRDGASGSVAIWEMNGTQIQSSAIVTAVSSDWHAVGVADFNGDGMADMLWKDAATGQVAVWEMNGTQITSAAIAVTAPTSWHVAGTGDFDGDGKADILLRDQASGAVAIWEMDGLALKAAAIVTTVSADWQVAGTADVNGDGMTDILWRNSAGQVAVWDMHGFSIASSAIPGQVAGSWSILNHHYDWV